MATGCKLKDDDRVYVVVGGGIAGVSCAEELSTLDPSSLIYLISSSPLIKAVTNFTKVSRTLEQFDIKEQSGTYLTQACPNVTVLNTTVTSVSPASHTVQLTNDTQLKYDKLCICTGGTPKVIAQNHPSVIGIRDTESVQEFQKRLGDARRIVVVGNGGIATELVYEVCGCEVIWVIKDHSITHTFVDEGAAAFFLPHLTGNRSADSASSGLEGENQLLEIKPLKRPKYTVDRAPQTSSVPDTGSTGGSALGPDWHSDLQMRGKGFDGSYRHVHVEYQCEVLQLLTPAEFKAKQTSLIEFPQNVITANKLSANSKSGETTSGANTISTQRLRTCGASPSSNSKDCGNLEDRWPVFVELTNKKVYGCDLVVSATGVTPNTSCLNIVKEEGGVCELKLSDVDGGIIVDSEMRSTLPGVYAAGDVCTVRWDEQPDTWFQMRLWTQARQMGAYTARCMVAHTNSEPITPDFCFELFAHVTQFFGYKVVLLGKYNAQGLGKDYEILLRCTKGVEYVKVILHHGKMVGAILIGETDLEETFENLILNGMDLSRFGESLLDPDIDIEDYFD